MAGNAAQVPTFTDKETNSFNVPAVVFGGLVCAVFDGTSPILKNNPSGAGTALQLKLDAGIPSGALPTNFEVVVKGFNVNGDEVQQTYAKGLFAPLDPKGSLYSPSFYAYVDAPNVYLDQSKLAERGIVAVSEVITTGWTTKFKIITPISETLQTVQSVDISDSPKFTALPTSESLPRESGRTQGTLSINATVISIKESLLAYLSGQVRKYKFTDPSTVKSKYRLVIGAYTSGAGTVNLYINGTAIPITFASPSAVRTALTTALTAIALVDAASITADGNDLVFETVAGVALDIFFGAQAATPIQAFSLVTLRLTEYQTATTKDMQRPYTRLFVTPQGKSDYQKYPRIFPNVLIMDVAAKFGLGKYDDVSFKMEAYLDADDNAEITGKGAAN
jgi:hypothetical protein